MTKIAESDDSDIEQNQVYEQDADNGLSHQKLLHVLSKNHARVEVYKDGDLTQEYRSIWETKTGRLSFDKRTRRSDLKEYGVGIVIYFQFVKYMSCLYFCLGLLSVPAMALFWASGESKVADLNELITATSLGNIGGSAVACGQGGFELT